MTNIKVGVIGASGRMGQEILAILKQSPETTAAVGLDRSGSSGFSHSVSELNDLSPQEVDVVIDFSSPELFRQVVAWAVSSRRPLVSGTTGLTEEDRQLIQRAGDTIPILWAPNMSLGVALMTAMFQAFANATDFDFQIEELHHKRKKDAPSGTALFLQEHLQKAVGRSLPEPLAIRGGGIFGIHRAWAMAEEETITIEHTAMNRTVFARGAVRAATWLAGQKPGVYKMADVLGLPL